MDEHGLLLVPRVVKNKISPHTTKNGNAEYFTELEMQFTWINSEKPDEQIVCDWYGQGLDSGEKGVGKAMTYAEKYFLLKFFNIATDKDDPDAFCEKHKKAELINEEQANTIDSMLKDNSINKDIFLKWAKVECVGDILTTNYAKSVEAIKAKIAQKPKENAA
jgi:hypothetical protein